MATAAFAPLPHEQPLPSTSAPSQVPMFTCISCNVAFYDPAMQRQHFGSDWHRYNMKRRIASLPPVSAQVFNAKVLERREQTAIKPDPRGMMCECCKKQFSTENAYRSHMASKKHRVMEAKWEAAKKSGIQPAEEEEQKEDAGVEEDDNEEDDEKEPEAGEPQEEAQIDVESKQQTPTLQVNEDAPEEDIEQTIDAKIARSRNPIAPTSCLFCSHRSTTIPYNLSHMSRVHSFFIPDQEYLEDLEGLLVYLGEKVAVGNVCLFCPNGGKEFTSLEAVRAHMRDKGHCKIAYSTQDEKLEISDYYDFEKSYPDYEERKARREAREERLRAKEERRRRREEKKREREEKEREEGWEDADEDGVVDGEEDEVVVIEESEGSESEEEEDDEDWEDEEEDIDDFNGISIADDGLSLRLPSGRTLGHRSLKVYYNQHLRPQPSSSTSIDGADPSSALTSKLQQIRQKLADPTLALVPVSGGSGAYGKGLEVMKARNAGEARWAKKVASQHLDSRKKEAQRSRVAMKVHNNQKHFRDPLLQ